MSQDFSNLRTDARELKKDVEFMCDVGKMLFCHTNVLKLKELCFVGVPTANRDLQTKVMILPLLITEPRSFGTSNVIS
jgi:hypothetical protein